MCYSSLQFGSATMFISRGEKLKSSHVILLLVTTVSLKFTNLSSSIVCSELIHYFNQYQEVSPWILKSHRKGNFMFILKQMCFEK